MVGRLFFRVVQRGAVLLRILAQPTFINSHRITPIYTTKTTSRWPDRVHNHTLSSRPNRSLTAFFYFDLFFLPQNTCLQRRSSSRNRQTASSTFAQQAVYSFLLQFFDLVSCSTLLILLCRLFVLSTIHILVSHNK